MPSTLLQTKLYVPRSPPGLIARPRLRQQLDRGAATKLTLVSAPAGFGKTTLVAGWLTSPRSGDGDGDGSIAWLSLDRDDNDSPTFWTYVITALQSASPGLAAGVVELLNAPKPPPIQSLLTSLVNEVDAGEGELRLVLDDYHLIEDAGIQAEMAFLLDHLPPRLHLILITRADPPLPLARLRARGELVEARARDLRFTPDEAGAYLNEAMSLRLTTPDVAALVERTEGWIAALQLAALSLHGRDDAEQFIAGFAGDDRYVVDYLGEEVLALQPQAVQSFLLDTSILSRLSGPLCDAVTGRRDGKAMLERLDRGNLFLVSLDDRRRWYRYHHLFADMLQARLFDERPDQVAALHRRASIWFEQNDELSVAIGHAIAAEDFERVADLIERAIPVMRRDRKEALVRRWLEILPDPLLRTRPVLGVNYAGTMLTTGDLDGVRARLDDVEQSLASSADLVVVDEQACHQLPALIAIYRAAMALVRGDPTATMTFASQSLDLVDEDDHLGRGAAAGLLGLAAWTTGDLEGGYRSYAESLASLRRAGHISDTFGCAVALADIRITQGRLGDALRTYQQTLEQASMPVGAELRGTSDMYVGLSQIYCERDDLRSATEYLGRSGQLGEYLGLPQNPYRWNVAMARIREAENDLDGAIEFLDRAERVYVGDFFPYVRPVPALKARVQLKHGDLGAARDWAQGQTGADELSYLREFEHVTRARVLLAEYAAGRVEASISGATELLARLLAAAEAGGRTGSVIEILILLALTEQTRGNPVAAQTYLERALTRAEPEGYVRIFVDEGTPMAALLSTVTRTAPTYVRRLLAAFRPNPTGRPAPSTLIDALSERELDVLRLLASELSGPQIARELVVSLNTVRTHTKSIYTKLTVTSRRAAVRRGEELGLLSSRTG